MGRHQKKGLDYFPLDVHMDDSVALLEVDHGLEGFAILIKLYQKIYANGYYIHVSDKELKLLSRNINIDINQLNVVIKSAISYRIFDKCLHKNYQILTSSGIQKRYLFAVERRISVNFIKQFLLLEEDVYINMKNVNIKEINVAENGINAYSGTHIKEKNIKDKEKDKEKEADLIIDYYNQVTGQKRRHSKTSREHINARLNEKYTIEDCKKVIDIKYNKWKDNAEMQEYITIETFFRPTKFEKYLNQNIEKHDKEKPLFPEVISPISGLIKREYAKNE